ncbi:MAG: hypothetical protein ACI92O_000448 [Colwellia sp.]|jgi:hypothetical protein
MLTQKIKYKIGTLSNGNRRIYIPNTEALNDANFCSQTRYQVDFKPKQLVLTPSLDGANKVFNTSRGENVIELCNKQVTDFLGDDCQYITATLKRNQIIISFHHLEEQRIKREKHFKDNLSKYKLTNGSLYAGAGILSLNIHDGMKQAGIKPIMKLANEIDPLAARINAHFNPIWKASHPNALFLQDNLETCDISSLPTGIDHLDIGQVCTPYSNMTPKAIRDIDHNAGRLFLSTINAIARINPATITLECTTLFKGSVAFKSITHALNVSGYQYQCTSLKGTDFGDFEHRNRFCLFAYSNGLADLFPNIDTVHEHRSTNNQTIADIKETLNDDHKSWKTYEHVKSRNTMDNLGYKNILIQDTDIKIPAIVGGYAAPKAGAPFLAHPKNKSKQRLLTVLEHCRIRKLPKSMTDAIVALGNGSLSGQSRTNVTAAHRILGVSVSPSPWKVLSFVMFSFALAKHNNQGLLLFAA